jgi:hypothetical protein
MPNAPLGLFFRIFVFLNFRQKASGEEKLGCSSPTKSLLQQN